MDSGPHHYLSSMLLYVLLLTPVLADLLCQGGPRGCGWHCGLAGQGAGACREGRGGLDCVCQPEGAPIVNSEYFKRELDEVVGGNGSDSSGLPYFIQQIVFLPLVRSYLFRSRSNLLDPTSYGLERATNFYISQGEGVLGAWYMWPEGGAPRLEDLAPSSTLVVYLHGNSMDRGFGHRVALYQVLLKLGWAVLAVDYRSYGDSSRVRLSEQSVVEDGVAVLSWLEDRLGPDPPQVLLWGHSLGTAIATQALVRANYSGVAGLVLESPFNTMEDEVKHFKVAQLTAWLGGFNIQEELRKAGVEFLTDQWLAQVAVPVLVLHSDDDPVVPASLGQRLVDTVRQQGKEDVQIVRFGAGNRLRHRYIHRAPGLQNYLRQFLASTTTAGQGDLSGGTQGVQ